MKPLLKVTVIRPFEDNYGRVEVPIGIVMRKVGEEISREDLQRQHPRYLGWLERNGYVKVELLTHCPTCGHELPAPADDETPAFNNVTT